MIHWIIGTIDYQGTIDYRVLSDEDNNQNDLHGDHFGPTGTRFRVYSDGEITWSGLRDPTDDEVFKVEELVQDILGVPCRDEPFL